MSGTPMLHRRTRVAPRFRIYDDEGQPQPMTPEQVADLVARARTAAEQEIARR